MTCIVGIQHRDTVYIGGDTAGSDDNAIIVRSDEKVFTNGPLIMGFTSSFRMGQLLRYALKVPKHDQRVDDMKWLVVDLMDALRECFKEKGILHKEEEVEAGGVFLLGYKGKLYVVDSDFQVAHHSDNIAAVGAGNEFAYGVLHYLTRNVPTMKPNVMINHALDAASRYCTSVSDPYTVMKMSSVESLKEINAINKAK